MHLQPRPATAAIRRLFLRRSVPYVLFAVACALSLAVSWYLADTAEDAAEARAEADFITDAQQMRRQIQTGLNSYLEIVRAGAVFVGSDAEMNAREFRRFVHGLELPERYPGLLGIGFAQCVARSELPRLARALRLDGHPIRMASDPATPEPCPVVFFEPGPSAQNPALGLDLAALPPLALTMAEARDSGAPAVSTTVVGLDVFSLERDANVVLFIPVYGDRVALASADARRRALLGFVFSPVSSARMFEDIVRLTIPTVEYEVYDGAAPDGDRMLARSPGQRTTDIRYYSSGSVQVPGREWRVVVRGTGDLLPEDGAGGQALVVGLALSVMLFLVTRAQARAWEAAARHEAELSASAEALRASEAEARAANLAKDEFLATLSHELRTPLNVILGWVALMRHAPLGEDRAAQALEIVERNARQQAGLIDDLLDVSRIVTGNLRLDLRPVAVAPIVSAVVEGLRPSADAKRLQLTVTPLPESSAVLGDGDRLRQMVWNLLANAIKFTPAGGSIVVELTRDPQRVVLRVRDTGVGIDPAFLPYVFERFRQADSSTTRAHSGVGLGLAIVRELVELHGGTVAADSAGPGQGSTFVMTLPAIATAAAPAHGAPLAPATDAAPALTGVRVLVVEDDPHTLDMLTTALQTWGAHVTAVASAQAALERLRTERPDIIVSDIAMPGEDGVWLMQRVRGLPGAAGLTPAIALTALARPDDRRRVLHAGYQRHLAKPVQLDELQRAVASVVAGAADVPA